MPPAILVPHPGGTSTPPMDRITYIPGTQITFPPRPYSSASVSPGGSAHAPLCWEQCAPVLPAHPLWVFWALFPSLLFFVYCLVMGPPQCLSLDPLRAPGSSCYAPLSLKLLGKHTSYCSDLELSEKCSVTWEGKACLMHLPGWCYCPQAAGLCVFQDTRHTLQPRPVLRESGSGKRSGSALPRPPRTSTCGRVGGGTGLVLGVGCPQTVGPLRV